LESLFDALQRLCNDERLFELRLEWAEKTSEIEAGIPE